MKRALLTFLLSLATPVTAGDRPLVVALGGDVMFGRMITRDGYVRHDARELNAWRPALDDADLALVNLETGICDEGRAAGRFPVLWAPPARLTELANAGVDVASIANNHALDCGPAGVDRTVSHLHEAGIASVGRRSDGPLRLSEQLVLIAATLHPPPYRSEGGRVQTSRKVLLTQVSDMQRLRPRPAIIVSLHWGKERSKRVAAWQRALAQELVDAGATVVAGHGPHTTQDVERIGDSVVFYSLGNLVFDDTSAAGRPVPPQVVRLARVGDRWRARVATPVAND